MGEMLRPTSAQLWVAIKDLQQWEGKQLSPGEEKESKRDLNLPCPVFSSVLQRISLTDSADEEHTRFTKAPIPEMYRYFPCWDCWRWIRRTGKINLLLLHRKKKKDLFFWVEAPKVGKSLSLVIVEGNTCWLVTNPVIWGSNMSGKVKSWLET